MMRIDDAVAEGERWLAHLEQEAANSRRLAELAAARRAGTLSDSELRRELGRTRIEVKVYDGARLADAVRSLILFARVGGSDGT